MVHSLDHTAERGRILFHNRMMHFVQAESIKSELFNFDGEVKKPGLRWLIEEGNWADVLSGKFDEVEEQKTKPEECWDLDEALKKQYEQQAELPESAYDL